MTTLPTGCAQDAPPSALFNGSVSVLCWAYNEELLVREFLLRVNALIRSCVVDYEIVVIDDCSTDRTGDIVRELQQEIPQIKLYRNTSNRNVGYSCQRAIREAQKEFLFWQTVDWSYDISKLPAFLELLHNYDVVAGVRRAPVSQRTGISKLFAAIWLLFGRHDQALRHVGQGFRFNMQLLHHTHSFSIPAVRLSECRFLPHLTDPKPQFGG